MLLLSWHISYGGGIVNSPTDWMPCEIHPDMQELLQGYAIDKKPVGAKYIPVRVYQAEAEMQDQCDLTDSYVSVIWDCCTQEEASRVTQEYERIKRELSQAGVPFVGVQVTLITSV